MFAPLIAITWHTRNGRGFRVLGRSYLHDWQSGWALYKCPCDAHVFLSLAEAQGAVKQYLESQGLPRGWGQLQIWEVGEIENLRISSTAYPLVRRCDTNQEIPCPESQEPESQKPRRRKPRSQKPRRRKSESQKS